MIHLALPKKFTPQFEIVSCFFEFNNKILLLHRCSHKPQGDTWGVPAGKVDPNESLQQAIIREVFQETGCQVSSNNLNYFQKVFVKYPKYDFIYHMYHTIITKKPSVKINSNEHQNFKWTNPNLALKMNLIRDEDVCIKLFYKI